MQLSDREVDCLRGEAQRTYREYGRVRQLHRADRSDLSLKSRLSKLQGRYEKLGHLLNGTQPNPEDPEPYHFDLSRLEPSKPRVHSPLAYRRENAGPPWHRRILRTGLRVRFIVSFIGLVVVLAIPVLNVNQNLGFYNVPTSSMEPTLLPDDHFIAYSSKFYERGQVVVVRDPEDAAGYLVKRIVGLPGDVVAVRNGSLVVNGDPVEEPYLHEKMTYKLSPVRVRSGEVFLLGDNRNHSYDSHIWKRGVLIEVIMGSVRQIYSPRSRMQTRITYTDVFAHIDASAGSQDERQARVPSY
ncbi:MAG: signal peptidase I [Candidatus Hydrogenedentes bacterium]|nr:signal peptidase I [Candidatus Hydrogenedentota bacterium]